MSTSIHTDIQDLWDTLKAELGKEYLLDWWLRLEYPWLEKETTPLLRVWWVLQNKYDEVFGVCGFCRVTLPAPRAACPVCGWQKTEA